jgi:hypothetical protein
VDSLEMWLTLGIFVADVGEEKFKEAPSGAFTGTRNDRWYAFKTGAKNVSSRNGNKSRFHVARYSPHYLDADDIPFAGPVEHSRPTK